MSKIRVAVHGASGKMGQTVIAALSCEPDIDIVGAVDIKSPSGTCCLPDGRTVPMAPDASIIFASCKPEVIVDFSTANAILPLARSAFEHGVRLVSGTTGISPDSLSEIDMMAKEHHSSAIIASNFAIGALVMIHLARIAARYFDYADITEQHHQFTLDAPSGTALSTAKAMAAERGRPFLNPEQKGGPQESRGLKFEGINIHSARMPGIVARQEVLFGADGLASTLKPGSTVIASATVDPTLPPVTAR